MSGGSFDYLCDKDLDAAMSQMVTLQRMVDLLEAEFPGTAAAVDSRKLLGELMDLWERWYESPLRELREKVWQGMEWWQSGDYGRDTAEARVLAYQGLVSARLMPVPGVTVHCQHCGTQQPVGEDREGRWHFMEHQRDGKTCPAYQASPH